MTTVQRLPAVLLCTMLGAGLLVPAAAGEAATAASSTDRRAGVRALHAAVERGDANAVRRAIAARTDLDAYAHPQQPYTPLDMAISHHHWEIAALLLDAGAALPVSTPSCGVSSPNCDGIRVLRTASAHAPTLARMKQRGMDLDAAGGDGSTALAKIITSGCPGRLIYGPAQGTTPTYAAGNSYAARPASAKATVKAAVPPVVMSTGPAPDRAACVRNMLEQGANPNKKQGSLTPLMAAVNSEAPADVAMVLVAHGARADSRIVVERCSSPNDVDGGGAVHPSAELVCMHQGELTGLRIGPLTWLALKERPDLAIATLRRDREVPAFDRDLVYFAAQKGQWDLALVALAQGMSGHAVNRADVTALMFAAQARRPDVVRALLAAGAKPDVRSDRSWAPIYKGDVFPAYIRYHSNAPALVGGHTALDLALQNGDAASASLLRAAGGR